MNISPILRRAEALHHNFHSLPRRTQVDYVLGLKDEFDTEVRHTRVQASPEELTRAWELFLRAIQPLVRAIQMPLEPSPVGMLTLYQRRSGRGRKNGAR